jgi:hypothetical protein
MSRTHPNPFTSSRDRYDQDGYDQITGQTINIDGGQVMHW